MPFQTWFYRSFHSPAVWTLGLASCLLGLSTPAKAEFYLHAWENEWVPPQNLRITPEFHYFSSDANFNASGNKTLPGTLVGYTRMQGEVRASYSFHRYFSVFGRTSWARSQVEQLDAIGSTDKTTTTAFGPADQSIGVAARLWDGRESQERVGPSLDLQGRVDFPAYNNTSSRNNNTPLLGDGTVNITGGIFLGVPFVKTKLGVWKLSGGAGIMSRSANYPMALPYSFDVSYTPWSEGFFASIGGFGIQTLQTRDVLTAPTGLAGSFAAESPSPMLLALRGKIGFQINNRAALHASVTQNLVGKNAPAGFSFAGGATFRWDYSDAVDPFQRTPTDYGKSNQGFVNYTFEAKITGANDRLNIVRIDKGITHGVAVGQLFDIFKVGAGGAAGDAIARAKCTSVKPEEAVLTISEYFHQAWIDEGYVVRRPIE